MKVRLTHKSTVREGFEQAAERAQTGSGAEEEVVRAIVDANKGVNFDPSHRTSIVEVDGFRGRLGARHPNGAYARLLKLPREVIAKIWKDHILGDR